MDCADGSDESRCPSKPPATTPLPCNAATQFDCKSGFCIPYAKVCDGKPDCPTRPGTVALDEQEELCSKQDKVSCAENNGGCEHLCLPSTSKVGRFCQCRVGYRAINATHCEDIDECATPGSCSQRCMNTPGSFRCSCYHGYILQRDAKTCRALGNSPKLLLANRVNIRQIDLMTKEYIPVIDHLHSAVAMDYIFANRTVIWSDVAAEKILM